MERTLDLTKRAHVLLPTGYQPPAAIRRTGIKQTKSWLKNRKVRSATVLSQATVDAAQTQTTALPGEKLAAATVAPASQGSDGPR
ncbi:hypothetical protein [Streptomyces sp. NPDC054940]